MIDFQTSDLPPAPVAPPAEMRQYEELRGTDQKKQQADASDGLRSDAIRQEGLRVGAQTGLAYRYGMLMDYCDKIEPKLNVAFNFAPFVRDNHLLIPSVILVRDQFQKEGAEVRVVRLGVTIQDEAQVISSVPTWRDYLYQRYDYPEKPHQTLFPKTEQEISSWKQALDDGYRAGVSQADQIWNDRLATLARAVEGRYEYITLEKRHMFSSADLKVVNSKVTFQGRTMNVGQQIITINNQGNFTQSQNWAPIWTK